MAAAAFRLCNDRTAPEAYMPHARVKLLPVAVRTYETVRQSIDEKLGSARMSPAECAKKLSPPEHAVWILDNLFSNFFDHASHLWQQTFCTRNYDGARVTAGIAEVMRSFDPTWADLVRWTYSRVNKKPVAMFNVVTWVWSNHAERSSRVLHEVAGRWPDDVDPLELPAAPRRRKRPSASATPTLPLEDGLTREEVLRAAAGALWENGASDAALDAFFRDYSNAAREVDALRPRFALADDNSASAWDRLHGLLHPSDPLEAWLGESVPSEALLLLAPHMLEELQAHLGERESIRGPGGRPPLEFLNAAFRFGHDVVLLEPCALDDEALRKVLQGAATGVIVVLAAEGTALDALAQRTTALGVVPLIRKVGALR